jgi:dipeptidyl aminopeptidase/acylaminoacyl peptidase
LRSLDDPRLSPDGSRALLTVRDATSDGGRAHLWLVAARGASPRQLTFGGDDDKGSERMGRWMPDGLSVLFLAKRGEHTSLQRLRLDGGESRPIDLKVHPQVDASRDAGALPAMIAAEAAAPIEDLPAEVSDIEVAPDGGSLAFMAPDPQTPGEKRQKEAKVDAEWADHDAHGTRLYLYDFGSGQVTPVGVPADVRGFEWSRDGARLVALVEGPNHASDLRPSHAAWLVEVAHPDRATRVEAVPATAFDVRWLPDGQSLLVVTQAKRDAPPGYADLQVIDLASGRATNLTDGMEGSLNGEPVALAEGGVLAPIARGVDVAPETFRGSAPAAIRLPLPVVRAINTNARQNGWLWLASGGGQPMRLYHSATPTAAANLIETPPLSPTPVKGIVPKRVEWKSDGHWIQGLLYLPPGNRDHPVPLVVDVHGGPTGIHVDAYSPFVDYLVGQGWAVLRPNPRGSTGRGAAFAAANKNDLGGGDYRDIMAGVDHLLKTERLDPARLALIGYSYGGEMAGFVAGRTKRFKAIVSGAPVIDQFSEYGTEEDSSYDRWFYGRPWEHVADAWRQSPLSTVGQVTTPFLLLQGQDDTTDPPGQALEMYRALRQVGAPVDLVTYPRVDHGGLADAIFGRPSPEPWHGFDARRRMVAFIAKAFGTPP